MMIYNEGPIIACSSGALTNSAIALIRISGFESSLIFSKIFNLKFPLKPRYTYFTSLIDEEKILDEICLTFFPAPHSYTGENTIELSVHGNILNIERIINFFINKFNFKLAQPGEFSYRALKNKKLSLSQVEGLDLLLNAKSTLILDQGHSLLSGKLSDAFMGLYNAFLKHKSSLEFFFDFLEDIGEERATELFDDSLNELKKCFNSLYLLINNNSNQLLSPDIGLIGLPNAGKSTFFNLLLGDNRAIVTDIAGTTRDYLKESLRYKDTIYNLIDTAGVRTTKDAVETEGIKRSFEIYKNAFYKILIINPFEWSYDFAKSLNNLHFNTIIFSHFDQNKDEFYNKTLSILDELFELKIIEKNQFFPLKEAILKASNTGGPIEPSHAGPIEPSHAGPIEPSHAGPIEPNHTGPIEPSHVGPIEPKALSFYFVNLLKESGLREKLLNNVAQMYEESLNRGPIILERHKFLLTSMKEKINNYNVLATDKSDVAILSHELNDVGHCISELIGIVSPDEVLNNIFSNFCIGK